MIKNIAEKVRCGSVAAVLVCLAGVPSTVHAADVDIDSNTTSVNLDDETGDTFRVFPGVVVSNGISATAQAWDVTNDGTINGFNALTIVDGGSLLNNLGAVISGTASGAIFGVSGDGGGFVTVDNYGEIVGGFGEGVTIFDGGLVTNRAGALIQATSSSNALSLSGGSERTVVNHGRIVNTQLTSWSTGILIQGAPGSITNMATGEISGGYNGIYTSGTAPLTLINEGLVESHRGAAVQMDGGGTVANTGTIRNVGEVASGTDNVGVAISGTGTVYNAGTIATTNGTVAIRFSGALEHWLRLDSGSLLGGNVQGGSGTDNLVLLGTGSEDIGKFLSFETLSMEGEAWTLTGTGTFSTGAAVASGLLDLNGILTTPTLTVDAGAILGGTGTLTGNALNNGILAPGNSIGTLTIVGDATFGATSTFRVEIEPLGTSDLLDVSGTVAISSGATLQVVKQVGSYTVGTEWLVLTAGTGITGAFDDPVLQSAPILDLAVEYRANPVSGDDMWLVLLSSTVIGVVDIAETPNQIATAYGVEDAGGAVLDAFTGMDEDIARAALDNLSGEVHATAFGAAFDSPWFREGVLARLREAHGGGRPNRPALAFAPDRASVGAGGGGADTATGASWRWWAVRPEGYLASSRLGADGNAAAATIATGGLILGADGTTGDVTLGFAAGFQKDRIGVSDRNSAADISTWNLGTYAGWTGSDGWRARGGAVAAWHGFATTREIVVPGLESTAEASYPGWSGQLFAEAGRVFDVGGGTAEPYAGLRLAHASRGAFSETGAGAAGLAADAEGRTALIAILGVNVATTVALPDGRWMRPHAGIAWEHAFADMTPSADLMFGGGSDAFHILGPTRGSDTIRLNAGLDVPLSASATAFVAYQGALASGVHAHAVRAGASIRF